VLTPGTTPVRTLWTTLDYTKPLHAREALAGREGCVLSAVGLWPGRQPDHTLGADIIAAWAQERGFDAVVWTALKPKFNKIDGLEPPSADAAVAYLKQLDAHGQAKAREYVVRAPIQVTTLFRRTFEQQLGWLAETGASAGVTPGK
jgi:hypothetical protein